MKRGVGDDIVFSQNSSIDSFLIRIISTAWINTSSTVVGMPYQCFDKLLPSVGLHPEAHRVKLDRPPVIGVVLAEYPSYIEKA